MAHRCADKACYRNRHAALAAKDRMMQAQAKGRWFGSPINFRRAYRCPWCKRWHLTSKTLAEYRATQDHYNNERTAA